MILFKGVFSMTLQSLSNTAKSLINNYVLIMENPYTDWDSIITLTTCIETGSVY